MIKGLIKGIKLSMLGMMTTGICCTAANCVYAEENNEIVKMQVFYENGCRSCNEQKDLQEMINEKTGAYKDELPCEVTFYNMFKTEEREEGNEILQENQLETDKLNYPVILVNGYTLQGDEEIEEMLPAAYQAVGCLLYTSDAADE